MNLEENGPIIKVDHNGDTLKIEVNDDILGSSADQNQFLSSDIGEEENVDFDQLENFCSLCEKHFNSPANLEIHHKSIHTNDGEIETKEANTSNNASENFNEKSKSSKEIYYFCSLCETQFYSCSDLELHLQTIHTNSEIESMVETNNTSTNNESIDEKSKRSYVRLLPISNDMKRIYSDYFDFTSLESDTVIKNGYQKSKAVCLTCQAVIHPDNNTLKYHAEKVHHIKLGTNPENYYASIEKKYSQRVNNSDEEENGPIIKVGKLYECEFVDCLASLSYAGLRNHMIEVHGKEFKCDICEKGFKMKKHLKEHLATAHNITKENLNCYKCDKVFNSYSSLEHHRGKYHPSRNSSGKVEKKFKCTICLKKFMLEPALKKHILFVHEGTKNFSCEYEGCDNKYFTKGALKQHILRFHEGQKDDQYLKKFIPSERENLPFQCDICGKIFATQYVAYRHTISIHEGREKNHCCEKCGKAFYDYAKLKLHVVNVHEGRYNCPYCEKACTWSRELKRHIRRFHKEEEESSKIAIY